MYVLKKYKAGQARRMGWGELDRVIGISFPELSIYIP